MDKFNHKIGKIVRNPHIYQQTNVLVSTIEKVIHSHTIYAYEA